MNPISKMALVLGTQAVDGSASKNSYVVIAKDPKKGAFIGIRPIAPGVFRLRMMPIENLGFSNWKSAYPAFNWNKTSDTRLSLVDGAQVELPETTESRRLSFERSRLTSRLANALRERLEVEGNETLVDLDDLAARIVSLWAGMLPGADGDQYKIDQLKEEIENLTGTEKENAQKVLGQMIAAYGAEQAEVDAPPGTLVRDFFEEVSHGELAGEAGSPESADTEAMLSNVAVDEAEEAKEDPEDNAGPASPSYPTSVVSPINFNTPPVADEGGDNKNPS